MDIFSYINGFLNSYIFSFLIIQFIMIATASCSGMFKNSQQTRVQRLTST